MRPLGIDAARKFAEDMEYEAERYYRKAAEGARDVSVRKLLIELAEAEAGHETLAHKLAETILTKGAREAEEETSKRMFMLQYVQPGLAGLMDGSVSTLAPLFAAAFATHNTWATFLVGMAASVGAGISMAFAEALSDDGSLTGRGSPIIRGVVTGGMTALGGLGHTLALSDPAFPHRHHRFVLRRRGGTGGDFLDPHQIHGHAVPAGGVPGGGRRRAGVRRRHIDRELVSLLRPTRWLSPSPTSPTRIWRRCRCRTWPRSASSSSPATSTGCAAAGSSTGARCWKKSPPI